MLPLTKAEFPKLLSLDQNKWIDLARAHYGRPDGDPYRAALVAIRAGISAGKIVAPMSAVNLLEASAPADAARRRRLAKFMVELSQNLALLPYWVVSGWETRNAVRSLVGGPPTIKTRSLLVGPGLVHALGADLHIGGVPPETAEEMRAEAVSAATTEEMLVLLGDERAQVERARSGEEAIAAHSERVRRWADAHLTADQRRGVELAEIFSKGVEGKALAEELALRGIPSSQFGSRFERPSDFDDFVRLVPSTDGFVRLSLARDTDFNRPIPTNDLRDLFWISVALPYSNLIVSEKHWAHMAVRLRLDAYHGTTILTDLRNLPGELSRMGCI